eukprot:scaffold105220_cov37-Prasinocladus_malaysianus.AAC.1
MLLVSKEADAKAQREEAEERSRKHKEAKKAEEEAERARRKALIMQYAEEVSSSSGEDDEGRAADESIEDWELQMWADPRE